MGTPPGLLTHEILSKNDSICEHALGWNLPLCGRTTNQVGGKPLEALGVSYQAEYSAVGKAHYRGKDLTEVRSLQRKLVPDMSGWSTTSQPHCRE